MCQQQAWLWVGTETDGMDFNAKDWERLTPEERVRCCRAMAMQAREVAAGAPPKIAAGFLRIAEQWLELADRIDRSVN
jgi:hypothetical protein